MPIYALLNCVTKEKLIYHAVLKSYWNDLPCGVYKLCPTGDIECKACSGTGGGEEISGGHKKECEACSGSGIDPARLKIFENESKSHIRISEYLKSIPKSARNPALGSLGSHEHGFLFEKAWVPHDIDILVGDWHTGAGVLPCKKCFEYWLRYRPIGRRKWGWAPDKYLN